MEYEVYILQNPVGANYIGHTGNIDQRLLQHNNCECKTTKGRGPWELIYHEKLPTRSEAMRREKQIKNYKGGEALRKLLSL